MESNKTQEVKMVNPVGKVESVKRMKSSRNGNPRFALQINGVWYEMAPNTNLAFGIENPKFANHDHEFVLNGRAQVTIAKEI